MSKNSHSGPDHKRDAPGPVIDIAEHLFVDVIRSAVLRLSSRSTKGTLTLAGHYSRKEHAPAMLLTRTRTQAASATP
jgi:hypothetical protein